MKTFEQIRESFNPLEEARRRKSGGKKKGRKPPKGGRGKKLSPKMKKMMNRFAKGNSSGKAISKKDLYNQWYGRAYWGGPADGEPRINYSKDKADKDAYEKKAASEKEYDKLYKKVERSYKKMFDAADIPPAPTRNDYQEYDGYEFDSYEEAERYFQENYVDGFYRDTMNMFEREIGMDHEIAWQWFKHFDVGNLV